MMHENHSAHRQSRWRDGAGNDAGKMSYDHQPRRRGQEEGNARLIVETNSGVIAQSQEKLLRRCSARSMTAQNNGENGTATSASSADHAQRSTSRNF